MSLLMGALSSWTATRVRKSKVNWEDIKGQLGDIKGE